MSYYYFVIFRLKRNAKKLVKKSNSASDEDVEAEINISPPADEDQGLGSPTCSAKSKSRSKKERLKEQEVENSQMKDAENIELYRQMWIGLNLLLKKVSQAKYIPGQSSEQLKSSISEPRWKINDSNTACLLNVKQKTHLLYIMVVNYYWLWYSVIVLECTKYLQYFVTWFVYWSCMVYADENCLWNRDQNFSSKELYEQHSPKTITLSSKYTLT